MKIILFIAFFVISMMGFAQTKNDSTELPKLTKEVIYNDVKDVLKSLGETLKVGSEHVYGILVKQQVVNSITNVITYLIVISLTIFLISRGNKELREDEYSNAAPAFYVPGAIIGIIGLVFFFITIQETVTGFVNPEYSAIEKIISLIKH